MQENQENNTGRREYDNFVLENLYEDVRNIRKTQIEIQETLNNGVKKRSINNSENISCIQNDIIEIKKYMQSKDSFTKGRNTTITILIGAISGIASGIIGVITALSLLNII